MANNRMFLVHKPSGIATALGKRMGWGWYTKGDVNLDDYFNAVIQWCSDNNCTAQDDFMLALEDCDGAPSCNEKWIYTDRKYKDYRIIEFN